MYTGQLSLDRRRLGDWLPGAASGHPTPGKTAHDISINDMLTFLGHHEVLDDAERPAVAAQDAAEPCHLPS